MTVGKAAGAAAAAAAAAQTSSMCSATKMKERVVGIKCMQKRTVKG